MWFRSLTTLSCLGLGSPARRAVWLVKSIPYMVNDWRVEEPRWRWSWTDRPSKSLDELGVGARVTLPWLRERPRPPLSPRRSLILMGDLMTCVNM
ncbi:uncharacterized protein LY79DRAFT_550108, partial [Colletotrichum navitas]